MKIQRGPNGRFLKQVDFWSVLKAKVEYEYQASLLAFAQALA